MALSLGNNLALSLGNNLALCPSQVGNVLALHRRKGRHEFTQAKFVEWWSPEMGSARLALQTSIETWLRTAELPSSFKNPEALGTIKPLTTFFDQLGWLAASGLIEIDDLLGPMAHVLRKAWIVLGPGIKRDRLEPGHGDRRGFHDHDPVYFMGMEWLYLYSEWRKQTKLLMKPFRRVGGPSNSEWDQTQQAIDRVERKLDDKMKALRPD